MTKIKEIISAGVKAYEDPQLITLGVNFNDPVRLPSGLFAFDLPTGGGVPLGRITLMYGKEDSMKTSVCLMLIAQAQRLFPKKAAVFVDVEGVFSKNWARTLGVDVDKLVMIQPSNAEQVVDLVEDILHTDDVSIIVVDSLAALITQHEIDKSAEDAIVARTASVINKFYRRTARALGIARKEKREIALVCVNQIRYKIGGMGNPEVLPGGPAMLYGASLSVRFYGKDVMDSSVSTTLPAFKEINLIIKKHKVPILAKTGVMQVALLNIPAYGLVVGEAYDWLTLLSYLKSMELFVKADNKKDGWKFTHPGTGEITMYKLQDDLKANIYDDPVFGQEVKSALIAAMMKTDEVIE